MQDLEGGRGSALSVLSRWENPTRAIPPRIPARTDPNQAEPESESESESAPSGEITRKKSEVTEEKQKRKKKKEKTLYA